MMPNSIDLVCLFCTHIQAGVAFMCETLKHLLYCTFVDVFLTLSGLLILQAHHTAAGLGEGGGGGKKALVGGVMTLSCTHASFLFLPLLLLSLLQCDPYCRRTAPLLGGLTGGQGTNQLVARSAKALLAGVFSVVTDISVTCLPVGKFDLACWLASHSPTCLSSC